MQSARFLKALVIGLGVAIFIALGFVIYGFFRLGTGADQSAPIAAPSSAALAPGDLGQPPESRITALAPLGNTRLAVAVAGGGLPDRIVVLDLKSGKVAATTYVSPQP